MLRLYRRDDPIYTASGCNLFLVALSEWCLLLSVTKYECAAANLPDRCLDCLAVVTDFRVGSGGHIQADAMSACNQDDAEFAVIDHSWE
jgi:hypothetical protein